jgi:hypothetical protein
MWSLGHFMNNREGPSKDNGLPKIQDLGTTTTLKYYHNYLLTSSPFISFWNAPQSYGQALAFILCIFEGGCGFFFLCSWKNMFCFFKVSSITKNNKIMKWHKFDQKN